MKNIKIYILIVIIIIIIIIASMIFIINKLWDKEEILQNEIDDKEELIVNIDIINKEIKYVDERNEYFAVQTCVQKYLQNIFVEDEQILYNILDKAYINENNITIANVLENIDESRKYQEEIVLDIDKMYTIKNQNDLCVYFIYGKIGESYENLQQDFYVMVRFDKTNDTFSIYPYKYMKKHNYLNLQINDTIEEEFTSIEKNDNNHYQYQIIDDEEISKEYFYNYINKMKYNTKKAYEMLDKEYKEKRFDTFEKFDKYIKNMDFIRIDTYAIKKEDGYTQYICKDVYGREYIFKETAIMQYTVMMDTYTLDNDTIRSKYASDSNRNRALYNIDKFIQMLNMQDYESAYKVLDNSFKENNFKTQQEFENYMKQHTFKYNEVTYNQYSNKISSLHTYDIQLTDISKQSQEVYNITITVKLLEDTKFSLSFERDV